MNDGIINFMLQQSFTLAQKDSWRIFFISTRRAKSVFLFDETE